MRAALILIGLLIAGPCYALLTARWAPTAASACFAVVLAVILGIPDQIIATLTQCARSWPPSRSPARQPPSAPRFSSTITAEPGR
jgi:hypothetical protein